MHDTSNDDEFFDAIGDAAQIEEVKAKMEQSRMSSPTKINSTQTTTISNYPQQTTQPQQTATVHKNRPTNLRLNLNKQPSDENENTLTISEREGGKGSQDKVNTLSPKNLQQILDKLEENSAIINLDPNGGRTGDDDTINGDSPTKNRNAVSMHNSVKRPDISVFNNSCGTPKSDETSQVFFNRNLGTFTRTIDKRNSSKILDKPVKKSFFSNIMSKKKNENLEFTKEYVKQHNKTSSNFDKLICLQYLEDEKNPASGSLDQKDAEAASSTPSNSKKNTTSHFTWIAKFSPNNRLLATGSSDGVLRVYKVTIMDDDLENSGSSDGDLQMIDPNFTSYVGHKMDIIDMSWYKNSNFILTSAIDKKVILWNIENQTLAKIFEHSDIVPCLSFHPLVDEFFCTGCFDKMVRIWDINEAKVVDWIQTNDLITALTFSPDKSYLLVGFYKGTVKIYRTDQGKLKFTMEITCKNTFSWGKLNKVGKKVTGIIFTEDYEFLVMTNDSRMRLVDLRTYQTKTKYKGHSSGKYHIQPSYNYQKELILSGSEDEKVYVWNKISDYVPQVNPIYSIQKANRNTSYEYFRPFGKSNTTCAVWVPFEAVQKYKEKVLSVWKDIYVDDLMVLFSSDSRIKVLGNLIELEPVVEKKPN